MLNVGKYAQSASRVVLWPFPGPVLGLAALIVSGLELFLHAVAPHGFWHNVQIGLPVRLELAGAAIATWAIAVWVAYWSILFLGYFHRRCRSRLLRTIVSRSTFCALGASLAIYVGSWLFQWRLGIFPDTDCIWFVVLNSQMVIRHLAQLADLSVVIALALLLGLACVLTLTMRSSVSSLSRTRVTSAVWRQAVVAAAAFNLLVSITFFGDTNVNSMIDPNVAARLSDKPTGLFELRYHTNPFITLISSQWSSPSATGTGEVPPGALIPIGRMIPNNYPEVGDVDRRDVIVITIESLRADAVMARGKAGYVMPCVESLARGGRWFRRCYANSTHSDYSDPCILSSLFPLRSERHHYYSETDPWPRAMIYSLLKPYGYATAIFSSQNETWGNMHAFYQSEDLDELFDSRSYPGATIWESGYFSQWMAATRQTAGKLDDAVTVSRAIEWIDRNHDLRRPYFLSMNLQSSHFPYRRPDSSESSGVAAADLLFAINNKDTGKIRDAYYSALGYVDSQIRRLVDYLDRSGQRGRTLVVITGDHGEAFGEAGVWGHGGFPIESVVNTALIVNCPGFIDAEADDYLVQSVDIVPTLLGRLALPPHPAHQGIDVMSGARPPNDVRLGFVHSSSPLGSTDAVITGSGWKYVVDATRGAADLSLCAEDETAREPQGFGRSYIQGLLNGVLLDWRQRQLSYYGRARYYAFFYPPRPPTFSGIGRPGADLDGAERLAAPAP